MKTNVVLFSGGIASYIAAKRVKVKYGTRNLILLFTDTMMEDEDLYRFIREAAPTIGGEFVWLKEGRDPWQVFHDKRFIGNSRIDPCSEILKRNMTKKFLAENFSWPSDYRLHLGLSWDEIHRYERAKRRWDNVGVEVEALLCEPPYLTKEEMLAECVADGIKPPRAYELGFAHNNCGFFCVKAGIGHFTHLLEVMPERFIYHEQKEQEMREYLGKDIAILERTRNKVTLPFPLSQLRAEKENLTASEKMEIGGCGCFIDVEEQ
jgi:hypothetical protein